jgi:hypothetical protein
MDLRRFLKYRQELRRGINRLLTLKLKWSQESIREDAAHRPECIQT